MSVTPPLSYGGMNQLLRDLNADRQTRSKPTSHQVILCGRSLVLQQQPGLSLRSTSDDQSLWVVCRWLEENKENLVGKRVLELGSGIGAVGIFCALLGADVTLTEQDALLPLLRSNVAANLQPGGPGGASSVQPFRWGGPIGHLKAPYDFVIANNIVSNEQGTDDQLVRSISDLSDVDTKILLSFGYEANMQAIASFERFYNFTPEARDPNRAKPKKFFDHLEKHFAWHQLTSWQDGSQIVFQLVKKPKFWLLE